METPNPMSKIDQAKLRAKYHRSGFASPTGDEGRRGYFNGPPLIHLESPKMTTHNTTVAIYKSHAEAEAAI